MKKFEDWLNDMVERPRLIRVLTEDAQDERDAYDSYREESGGCRCHISPPCGSCTHPGNPMNQDEDESAWRMVPEDQVP